MTNLDLLKSVFGTEGERLHNYLANKNKGGHNNAKGNVFENFYAVFQIAKCFNEKSDTGNTLFSSQVFAFIDDLVIEFSAGSSICYFQIKDVEILSWTSGTHSLKEDFTLQKRLLDAQKINGLLTLVVAKEEVFSELSNNIPEELRFVRVIQYCTASSMSNLIRTNSLLKAELTRMCALTNPAVDKLEVLGTTLLGVWDSVDKNRISLTELMDRAHAQSPNYIKGLVNTISLKLSGVFETIKGFIYHIENGYIVWEYNATDSGVVEYLIGSLKYNQWESDIFNAEIQTFEDLESFLSA